MSDLRQAAQQALESLEGVLDTYGEPLDLLSISGGTYEALQCRDAITALRAALAEPERKPLTEEQVERAYQEIWRNSSDDFGRTSSEWIEAGIRYAERAHGIGEQK